MKKLRLGLVGANNQGREHLRGGRLSEQVEIVAVCDVDEARRLEVRSDYPDVFVCGAVPDLRDAGPLDGVIVALPHHIVADAWPALVALGIPLLKEKPLGRSLPEAQELVSTARRAGVPVVTAIQRRFHPSYLHLADRLKSLKIHGVAATMHLGRDDRRAAPGWRSEREWAGGGALLDSGYHLVDLVIHLIGPVEFVYAVLWTPDGLAGPRHLETDAVVVGRADSTWVRIESRVGGLPDQGRPGAVRKFEQIEVECEGAVYRADRSGVWVGDDQVFSCPPQWDDGMKLQLDRFASMIRSGHFDEPVVWDQVAAMRLIDRAYDELDRYARAVREDAP